MRVPWAHWSSWSLQVHLGPIDVATTGRGVPRAPAAATAASDGSTPARSGWPPRRGCPWFPAAILGSGDVLPPEEHGRVHKARCEVRFGAPLGAATDAAELARSQVRRMLETRPQG